MAVQGSQELRPAQLQSAKGKAQAQQAAGDQASAKAGTPMPPQELAALQASLAPHIAERLGQMHMNQQQMAQQAINAHRVQDLASGAVQTAADHNAAALQAAYNAFHPHAEIGGPGPVALGAPALGPPKQPPGRVMQPGPIPQGAPMAPLGQGVGGGGGQVAPL